MCTTASMLEETFIFVCLFCTVFASQPNIIFIVADDLGWNDVGFRNPDLITPNIDKLAREGVILNQTYVQPVCTPSRNAFMSGVYPFKAGLQRLPIFAQQPACAPLDKELLPQKLKKLGYATHIIGKWHLGFCNWNCTPTARGFDTFFGYYNGKQDYYTRNVQEGYDFRNNTKPIKPQLNRYSTYVYADYARDLISAHDKSKPLFLYLAMQSVHSPVQVTKEYENMYPGVKNDQRRAYSGMVTAMDDLVGNVTENLKARGLYENSLIIFTSDNGGNPQYGGNNFPLRGGKCTIYEGGTRAVAFIHGVGLKKTGYTFDGVMHAVDWMPTVVSIAGGSSPVTGIDGMNLWPSLQSGAPSPRKEFVYNLDSSLLPFCGHAAIRMGDFKFINGFPGILPDWYPVPTSSQEEKPLEEYDQSRFLLSQLYNIKEDPNEHHNLVHDPQYSAQAELMYKRMKELQKGIVPLVPQRFDNASNPENYGGFWSPGWC